ncbi:MAG: winged helix-turn-helix domain-containing protein [Proteobacteria bacterium]|nr:winged helix-turn-helix domain-containing protein [Pseudomonadota bacterium]
MSTNAEASGGGVWVTCADLARRRGVSPAAITKRVDKLVQAGKVETRRDGRSRLVELASFDRAIGETGDAIKEQAAETAARQRKSPRAAPAMRDAQAERAQYEARLKALDLAERQKALLPITGAHGIEAASDAIGAALANDLDSLTQYADDLATAVSKDGVAGARRLLKEIAVKIRRQVAGSLSQLANQGAAAERDGPIETLLPDE